MLKFSIVLEFFNSCADLIGLDSTLLVCMHPKKEAYFLSILPSALNIFVFSDLRMVHSMG